jgi:hypothetical protein
MELIINGVLSAEDRKYITSYNNGYEIAETIDKLYEDGLTSPIRIIGHMDSTSYIITQYEVFIISVQEITKGHASLQRIRLQASDLRHLNTVVNSLKEQA